MLLEITCASAICFAPELKLYSPSRQEINTEVQRAASPTVNRFVNVQDIVVSSGGLPLRYLTEPEQRALDRALYKSIRIVDKGRLSKSK